MIDDIVFGPAQGSPLWHDLRDRIDYKRPDNLPPIVLGATKAAVVCNQSPYSTALDLYNQLCGLQPPWQPAEGDLKPELGIRLESTVLSLASRLLPQEFPELMDKVDSLGNLEIRTGLPLMWRSSNPLVGASLDGLLDDNTPVDAKTTWSPQAASQFGESAGDDIPIVYIFQAQQQMYVVGAEFCYFPVLFGSGGLMRCYRVPRNETLITAIIAAEIELIKRVKDRRPPEPNWESSAVLDAVRTLHSKNSGEIIEAPEELIDTWDELDRTKKAITELNKIRDKLTAQVMIQMGDADTARSEDQEIFRVEQPELIYTDKDTEKVRKKEGTVKRKSFYFLKCRLRKKGIENVRAKDDVITIGHTG